MTRLCSPPPPESVIVNLEHFIDKIGERKEKKNKGRGGHKYLVRWMLGQGPENDLWLSAKELENYEARLIKANLFIYFPFYCTYYIFFQINNFLCHTIFNNTHGI